MMGGVLVGLAVFFVFMTQRLTGADMVLLYSNLGQTDSNQIIAQLQQQNVAYEIEGKGSQIMVPAADVARLRLAMAAEGLPGSSTVGYEIFDNASAIGSTNFLQDINLVRALEGELARTIRSLKSIQSARVHLVLPKRQLFSRDKQQATASVVIKMRTAGRLTGEQIASVQHLVSAAVPLLEPSRVSLIDDRGNLLARGDDVDTEDQRSAGMVDRRVAYEIRMAREITDLLEKLVGSGKVKATVTANLDFDRISTTQEIFDPEGQVVRGTTTRENTSVNEESEGQQAVSVATNLPDGVAGADGGPKSSTRETSTEEVVNFEISKTITNRVRELGTVKRLSVAVVVDHIAEENEDGDLTYIKRTDAYMANLAKLVSSAIGFNEARGDTIEVINMRFSPVDVDFEEPLDLFFGLDKNDMLKIAEVVILAILVILIILLVVRPILTRAFESLPAATAAIEQQLLQEQAAAAAALSAPPESGMIEGEEGFDELIDIDRVEGRVRASSVKKVGEIVEKHPEEALSIIRNWLYQEG